MPLLHHVTRRFLLATLLLAACDDDPAGPTNEGVAGSYTATTFTTTSGGATTDQLAQGASLAIDLAANGATTGRLIIPSSPTFGSAVDADMAGTWTLSGTTVDFSQGADTFVRDMPFQVVGSTLVGDQTFGGTRVRVTLEKGG